MNRFHTYLILGFLLVFLILLFYSVNGMKSSKVYEFKNEKNHNERNKIVGKLSYDTRDMSNTKLIAASNPSNSVITILNDIASRDGSDIGNSIYVGTDNKVYIVGSSWNGKNEDLIVVRFENDGKVDTTFGNNGYVVLNGIAGRDGNDVGNSIYVGANNKVYITGSSWNGNNEDLIVVRLESNGKIDTTFGNNGYVVLDNIAGGNGNDVGNSIYVGNDGEIYVTGSSMNEHNDYDLIVVCLENNGKINTAFGNNGYAILSNLAGGNNYDIGNSVHVDIGGRVYVAGWSWNGNNDDLIVVSLEKSGLVNSSFGKNGCVVFRDIFHGIEGDRGYSVYVENDSEMMGNNKIYVAGRAWNGKNFDIILLRLYPNGLLDVSFGNKGFVVFDSIAGGNGHDEAYSVFVDDKGKIYVTGWSWGNSVSEDLVVLRLNSDGSLDKTFGKNGCIIFDKISGREEIGKSIFVDSKGKIFITGYSRGDSTNKDLIMIKIE